MKRAAGSRQLGRLKPAPTYPHLLKPAVRTVVALFRSSLVLVFVRRTFRSASADLKVGLYINTSELRV